MSKLNEIENQILIDLASALTNERARGCHSAVSLFLNGGTRWALKYASKFLSPLLALDELCAKQALATIAYYLWGAELYPEAVKCLEATMGYESQNALSDLKPVWKDSSLPITRKRELAVHGLWLFESLLAVERIEEAKKSEAGIIKNATEQLPEPIQLTMSNIYELGTIVDFCACSRVRAAKALRLKALGQDTNPFRKIPKKKRESLKKDEIDRLRDIAKSLLNEAMKEINKLLPKFAEFVPGKSHFTNTDQERIGKWNAVGYAELGLLERDIGNIEKAKTTLAIAHWMFSVYKPPYPGAPLQSIIGPLYAESILSLAPEPKIPTE